MTISDLVSRSGLVTALLVTTAACGGDSRDNVPPRVIVSTPTPAEYLAGEQLFDANCSVCHGQRAAGTRQGPPLVHVVYESSHHSDVAFYRAVQIGVRSHHWNFGDMSPVPGTSQDDVRQIVSYVRWLQREAGIF